MADEIRVLHLEDSPRDAEIIRQRLAGDGLCCRIVIANGKDSFEAALSGEVFDLVISDYNLPGYDGISALKRAHAAQPDVPVILISGTVIEEQAVQCLHTGATDYLLKERLDRLGSAVRRALAEAEARRARRRVDAALVESEARKAAILDSVLDCIVTIDASGTVLEFNAAAARTFGYAKAEAIGRPLGELIIPPRFRGRYSAGMARYLATGEGSLIGTLTERIAMRSDGTELPVELAITEVRSGPAVVFTGVLRDITARKQEEATRALLAAIVDTSEDAIFSMDLGGTVLTWNDGAARLYGYSDAEMIGGNREFLVPTGKKDELQAALARAARGEVGQPVETQRTRRDGTVVDVSIVLSPMADPAGRITGLSEIVRDITIQKRTEASLRDERDRAQRAVQARHRAEERMRFALESAHVGIWDMDYITGELCWSPTMEAQYGLAEGTFCETFEAFVELVHPDDRASLLATVGKAMRNGGDFSIMNRALLGDGSVRWLSGRGHIVLGEHGEPVRGIGISQDVTERHMLEAQYQQAQKMEAIGCLAGGVAHDFNNLLTVILGFCELLLADFDPRDRRKVDVEEIQKAGTRAAGLTRQLLAFSRKEIIQPTRLDLNTIVADIRVMLGRLIGDDVKVEVSLAPKLAPITADRGQVEQIVLNLAINARDAMPRGGTLTIKTADVDLDEHYASTHLAVAPGPYIVLTVTDTGTGMTPEVQARLFEPFFTTKEPGKGTGLGLATVHGIAARSGGSVTVDSAVGRGSSFMVYFPRAEAADALVADSALAETQHATALHVLVVDDAEGLRVLTKRLLERLGHTVLLATNADEAVLMCDENPLIDLLLTDVVMPGASGPELVSQLAVRRPSLRVIYMSGYTDEAIVHHGVLDAGIAFLHKPFTSETLGRKIREVMER